MRPLASPETHPRSPASARATGWAVLGLALAGGGLRAVLAILVYPVGGDPVYSYTYRAVLLAHGKWAGLTLLWHPPGYPVLLAALYRLSWETVPPYVLGVAVSVLTAVGLVLVVDRLVRDRLEYPGSRIVVASFVAFYEGLYTVGTAPLTEPVYLLLTYGAILVLDRGRLRPGPSLSAGLLVGAAATLRLEGFGALAGMCAILVLFALFDREEDGSRRVGFLSPAALLAGGLVVCGGLIADPSYLLWATRQQEAAYTFPVQKGLARNVGRAVEAAYFALVEWLPQLLLLPYWCLAAIGLVFHRGRETGRLNALLAGLLVPTFGGVVLSIMHKRSGAFLLPAAAIWLGFGVEALVRRFALVAPARRRAAFALVVAVNLLQAGRFPFTWARHPVPPQPTTWVEAKLVSQATRRPAKVWAFGSEPEVYAYAGFPVVYPFRDRELGYNLLYTQHRGDPAAFIEALRSDGFRYLTFKLDRAGGTAADAPEEQPYSYYSGAPRRSDLEELLARPAELGVRLLASAPALGGRTHVYLLEIVRTGRAGLRRRSEGGSPTS